MTRTRLLVALGALGLSVLGGVAVAVVSESETALTVLSPVALVGTTGLTLLYALRRGDGFSLLALSAVFYLLAFAGGALYFVYLAEGLDENKAQLARLEPVISHVDYALALGSLSWVMFVVGYLLLPVRGAGRAVARRLPAQVPIPLLIVSCLAVGWLARAGLVAQGRYFHFVQGGEAATSGSSTWTLFALSLLPLLATALLGAWSASERAPALRRPRRTAFWALWAIELAWAFPTGERGQVVGLFLLAAIVTYYSPHSRLNWRMVLPAAAALVFVVFPVVLNYRGDNRTFQSDPVTSMTRAVTQLAESSPLGVAESGLGATLSRFSTVVSVAAIRTSGTDHYPRAPGETYTWAVSGFVPRAIWAEKVDPGRFGNEFGRTYGLAHQGDLQTSISITHTGEAYLNFGLIGVIVVMTLIGGAYRFLDEVLAGRRRQPLALALYAVLAWPLTSSMETIVANGLVGAFKILAVFLFFVVAVTAAHQALLGRPERARALAAGA